MRTTFSALFLSLVLLAVLTAGRANGQVLALEPAFSDISGAVFLTHAGDGSNRIFILEQAGRVKVAVDGVVQETPYLNIVTRVTSGGERGFLGLAFAPDFEISGHLYASFTTTVSGQLTKYIVRYTANPPSSNTVDPDTQQLIFSYAQPLGNHNGGWIGFGRDGYLYIATGDGGGGGDQFGEGGNGQNTNVVLGKILRLDVSGGNTGYAIPSTNPFFELPGQRGEIWAYGLRNPWRPSFDAATGDLYIADVGQDLIEEVNFQSATASTGGNYGWRVMEGNACFDDSESGGNPPCNDPSFTAPIHTYDQTGGRCSITGGYVYRGSDIPRVRGEYFFADYCSHNVYSFTYVPGTGVVGLTDRTSEIDPGTNISSFGEDERGELYVVSPSEISKVVDTEAESVRTDVLPVFAAAAGNDAAATFAELQEAFPELTNELFEVLDANNDETITLPELLNVAGIWLLHHADQNLNGVIELDELLRVIQLYNASRYSCNADSEDGFQPGPGSLNSCARHTADYGAPQGVLSLSELLRLIQFYNVETFSWCPDGGTEDGFCPGNVG